MQQNGTIDTIRNTKHRSLHISRDLTTIVATT